MKIQCCTAFLLRGHSICATFSLPQRIARDAAGRSSLRAESEVERDMSLGNFGEGSGACVELKRPLVGRGYETQGEAGVTLRPTFGSVKAGSRRAFWQTAAGRREPSGEQSLIGSGPSGSEPVAEGLRTGSRYGPPPSGGKGSWKASGVWATTRCEDRV